MTTLICLPAHILDAHIAPRAREVLMLLASQTSAAEPALWICQKTVAERLRCSVATVARSIAKLVEAKLIAETGKLHQGKHKFYHVRWSTNENLKAVTKKIMKPVRKRAGVIASAPLPDEQSTALQESDKTGLLRVTQACARNVEAPPNPVPPSAIYPTAFTNDSLIAHYAEIARQKHLENKRRYEAMLLELR